MYRILFLWKEVPKSKKKEASQGVYIQIQLSGAFWLKLLARIVLAGVFICFAPKPIRKGN